MSESCRVLNRDGKVTQPDAQALSLLLRIDGEADAASLGSTDLVGDIIVVEFNGVADGRGFSQFKALRDAGFDGQLYAGGLINPDQLSMAFQTGFDGVLVSVERWEDYGEESWMSALTPVVNLSYGITESSQHRSIWQARHTR